MRDAAAIETFWARFVERAGEYPRAASELARLRADAPAGLPDAFVELTTRGAVGGVSAPSLRVGAVGDWLAHALERHSAMRALADVHGNPRLAVMVPFGDTPDGLEVALDLSGPTERVVWLDPGGYDSGDAAIVAVEASSVAAYVASRLNAARVATH